MVQECLYSDRVNGYAKGMFCFDFCFGTSYGAIMNAVASSHRYRKAKIDCLSFVMCPLLAQLIIAFFFLFFFAAAIYSTN